MSPGVVGNSLQRWLSTGPRQHICYEDFQSTLLQRRHFGPYKKIAGQSDKGKLRRLAGEGPEGGVGQRGGGAGGDGRGSFGERRRSQSRGVLAGRLGRVRRTSAAAAAGRVLPSRRAGRPLGKVAEKICEAGK